jgi:hypothetical protein
MSNEIIGSKIPARNGYGQNGAQNASSDLPGEKTTSGFLPKGVVPNDATQVRTVSAQPIAPAHGMRDRAAETPAKVPSKTHRG